LIRDEREREGGRGRDGWRESKAPRRVGRIGELTVETV
jgi:hypothetical protein